MKNFCMDNRWARIVGRNHEPMGKRAAGATFVGVAFLLGFVSLWQASAGTADVMKPPAAVPDGRSLAEFVPDERQALPWMVVNDGVMGGLSRGRIAWDDAGILGFSGHLSLDNNGGFSSIRTNAGAWNLADQTGISLRVRGDGRNYQFRLQSDARYRGMPVSFSAEFATTEGQWVVVHLPFEVFRGGWRGMDLPNEDLNPGSIRQLGILLGDKREGPFALEIDWIRTFTRPS